jgi:hypothetical protein
MCWQCGRPILQRFPRRARRFAAAIAAGLADSAAIMTLAELSRAFRKVNYPRRSVTRAAAGACASSSQGRRCPQESTGGTCFCDTGRRELAPEPAPKSAKLC